MYIKSKQEINDYFIKNHDNLNPIEGMWSLGVIRTLYKNGKRVASESEPHRMSLAIIKEGDLFRVHDVNGEPSNYIAHFNGTNESGNYDYQCYFTETNDLVKTIASFSGDLFLRYEYDAPKGIMMKYYYKSGLHKGSKLVKKMIEDGSLRLNWKFSWLKYSPVDSTKAEWQILDYWDDWDNDFPTITNPFFYHKSF
tara:strand:+ start:120 stop:707 length:588 start_codon:yes stop_codon:yes gene_type:complete